MFRDGVQRHRMWRRQLDDGVIAETDPSQDVTLMHVLVGGVLAVSVMSAILMAIQGYYNLYVAADMAASILYYHHGSIV